MRDSISLLDQLSLLGVSKEITVDDVNAILGRISFDTLHKLSEKIISSKPNEAIEIINDIYNSGNEPLQILINLSEYFKNLLITKNCKKELLPELTGLNEPQTEELSKQKDLLETQQIVFILERITYYIKEVKMAVNQHLWLEVGIIDLSNMTENTTLLDLQNRVKALENGEVILNNSPAPTYSAPQPKPLPVTKPQSFIQSKPQQTEQKTEPAEKKTVQPADNKSEDIFTPPPMSKKSEGTDIESLWEALLANINSNSAKALLKQMGKPVKITKDEIIITLKTENFVAQYSNPAKKDLLVAAAKILFKNANTNIIVRLPQPGDEKLAAEQNISSNPVSEEKKKIAKAKSEVTETTASNLVVSDQPQNTDADDQRYREAGSEEETEISQEEREEQETEHSTAKVVMRPESDQEKMVRELFDGTYIE